MNDITISGGTLEILILFGVCVLAIFVFAFVVSVVQGVSGNEKRLDKLEQKIFPKKEEEQKDE